jgi:biotin transport system substrate-specific component
MADVFVQARKAANTQVIQNTTARRVLAVLLFALLTALGAHLAVPLPGTAVPITMQTLFVTLAGAMLGPYLGAASQVVYLLAGIAGAPVFAMGSGLAYLLGPTGGYLLSYPAAAALTGVLCGRDRSSGLAAFARIALAMLIASALILGLGWAQLTLLTGNAERAFRMGVLPFLLGDVLKIALGALVAQRLRARTLGRL